MHTRPITTHFDKQDSDAIERLAITTDRSMSSVVRVAVRRYLRDIERQRQIGGDERVSASPSL